MAKQTINLGASANDGTGDPARAAGDKINDNFDELYGYRLDQWAAPNVAVTWNSQKITNLANPTSAQDAATKAYVDAMALGMDPKASVLCATTGNVSLSGEQTIDGVMTSASRVLVKNQSTAAQNGIYVTGSGDWARASDADTWSKLPGAFCFVEQGSTQADTGWLCTVDVGGTLGSTAVAWGAFGASVADGSVTNAKLAAMADATVKGRAAGAGSGTPVDLTAAQLRSIAGVNTFAAYASDTGYLTLTNAATWYDVLSVTYEKKHASSVIVVIAAMSTGITNSGGYQVEGSARIVKDGGSTVLGGGVSIGNGPVGATANNIEMDTSILEIDATPDASETYTIQVYRETGRSTSGIVRRPRLLVLEIG